MREVGELGRGHLGEGICLIPGSSNSSESLSPRRSATRFKVEVNGSSYSSSSSEDVSTIGFSVSEEVVKEGVSFDSSSSVKFHGSDGSPAPTLPLRT